MAHALRRALIVLLGMLPYVRISMGHPIYVTPDGFGAVEENLMFRIYFSAADIASADTIVDLGSHVGTFTVYAAIHAKRGARIIAVEPDERNYTLLLNNISLLDGTAKAKGLSIYAIRKAVWKERGELELVHTGWSEGAYVRKVENPRRRVEAVTLDDLLTLAHGRTIVKADVEDAELPAPAPSQLKGVAAISVEAHGNEDALAKLLAAKGSHASITRVTIPHSLFRTWLRTGPSWYT